EVNGEWRLDPTASFTRDRCGTLTEYSIVFDGGAIGNPGRGYGSYEISGPGGLAIRESVEFNDRGDLVTNNEAEYLTLTRALERLLSIVHGDSKNIGVTIYGDSALVVNQVNGVWKIKSPHLRELRENVVDLIRRFGKVD